MSVLGRGQQHDAARLPDREGRLDVAREEQPLDRHQVRLVERDQLVDERMDREQPLRQRQVRRS